MQTTLPTLADPSQSFFDIRGFPSGSGRERLQTDRDSGGEFSSLLDTVRDQRREPSHSDASSSLAETAQKSSHAAQSLPDEKDDADGRESEASSDQADKTKGAALVMPNGADRADELDGSDRSDRANQVAGSADESDEADAIVHPDDEVSDAASSANGGTDEPFAQHVALGPEGSTNSTDDEGDGDADQKRGQTDQRAQSKQTSENRREGQPSARRADEPQTATVNQTGAAARSQRGGEHPHINAAGEQTRLNDGAKQATDESSLPPHLEKSSRTPPDRSATDREPTMLDQRHDRDHRVMPAASRVQQVESQVRLENASGQSGGTDISSRIILPAQTGSNGSSANGEQTGQNLPGQTYGSAERATPDDARFSGRVIRGLTAMINQRGGTMTMRLDPPELGQLRVQMTLARGTVSASFFAQTNQARALLEKNMAALRTALESQGLSVERLNVQTSQSSNQQGHLMNDDNAQRHQEQHRHDAGGGESRGKRDEGEGTHGERQASADFTDVIEQLEQTQDMRH